MSNFKLSDMSIWVIMIAVVLALSLSCTTQEQTAETDEQGEQTAEQQVEETTPSSETEGEQAAVQESTTVNLNTLNDSGISGTVTLEPANGKTQVTVNLEGTPEAGVHPAHIHEGTCDNLGAPKYPLNQIEGGTSTTTIDASVSDLTSGNFAINVHMSPDDMQTYVACGNVQDS